MTTRNLRCLVSVLGLTLALCAAGCQGATTPAGDGAARTDLRFGPYVTAVSPDAASVHWISPPGIDGSCTMLEADAGAAVNLTTAAIPDSTLIRHTARVTGLRPDAKHWYRVTAGADSADGSFRTPPAPADAHPFSFIITGDTQSFPLRIEAVADAIASEAPAFIIHTGDLCNDTRDWSLLEKQFFTPWRDLLTRAPIWPARGNHEFGAQPFSSLFNLSSPWYSFDYGKLHVVILDQWSADGSADMEPDRLQAMAAWLDADLAAARPRSDWILVAGHQPMFNVAGHGSTWGHDVILPILYRHGVDLVVGGHSHLYERFVPIGPAGAKPIQFLVAGGGGGPNYPYSPSPILLRTLVAPHFCAYRVDGDRLHVSVRNSGGTLIDQFTLTRTDGQPAPNVVAAAIPPEDAQRLLKVYKGLVARVAEHPSAGKPITFNLETDRFPPGSKVHITTDPGSDWAVQETSFDVAEAEPAAAADADTDPDAAAAPKAPSPTVPLVFTPPPDVLLGPGRSFSTAPTVNIGLTWHGRTWSTPAVPIGITTDTLRQLTPDPEVVSVPRTAADITLDGDLAEWKDIPFLHLPSTGKPAANIKLAWGAGGLFGAIIADQPGLHVDTERPWNADSIEIDFEADAQRRIQTSPRTPPVKLFMWPKTDAEEGDAAKIATKRMAGVLRGGSVQGAWRKTPTGYALEFRVAAKALANSSLEAGKKIGFDLVLRRDGEIVEQFADVKPFRSTWSTPLFWGMITLSDN